MEQQLGDLTTLLRETQTQNQSIKRALDDNTTVLKDFASWRPQVDTKVDELASSVQNLQIKVDQMACLPVHPPPTDAAFATEEIDLTKSTAPASSVTSSGANSGPAVGHGSALHHRSSGNGVVTTFLPPPVIGAKSKSGLYSAPYFVHESLWHHALHHPANLHSAIPPMEFPKFDGTNPKLWKKDCESYFEIYAIPSNLWVKYAVMNFVGSASFWKHSVEAFLHRANWSDLCHVVCERFDRDQQNHL